MSANPFVSEFAEVAVHAENLKPRRVVVSSDPVPHTRRYFSPGLRQRTAMFSAVIVDVVKGQEGLFSFAAARTLHAAIGFKDFSPHPVMKLYLA